MNNAILSAFGVECFHRLGKQDELREMMDQLLESLAEADALCGSRSVTMPGIGSSNTAPNLGLGISASASRIYPCGTNYGSRGAAGTGTLAGGASGSVSGSQPGGQQNQQDLATSVRDLLARRNAERESRASAVLAESERDVAARAARADGSGDAIFEQANYSGPNPKVPRGWSGTVTGFVESAAGGCTIVATRSATETDPTGQWALRSSRQTFTDRVALGSLRNARVSRTVTPQPGLPAAATIFVSNDAAVVSSTLESANAVRSGSTSERSAQGLFFLIRDSAYAQQIESELVSRIARCGGTAAPLTTATVAPKSEAVIAAEEWKTSMAAARAATHGTVIVYRKRRRFTVDVEPEVIVATNIDADATVVAHIDNNTFVRLTLPAGDFLITAPMGMGQRLQITPGSLQFLKYDMSESHHHDVFPVPESVARREGRDLKPLGGQKIFHRTASSSGDPFTNPLTVRNTVPSSQPVVPPVGLPWRLDGTILRVTVNYVTYGLALPYPSFGQKHETIENFAGSGIHNFVATIRWPNGRRELWSLRNNGESWKFSGCAPGPNIGC